MKIAIDIRNIGKKRTGSEVVVFELVRHLAQIDSENEYYLLIDNRSDEEISEVEKRLNIGEKSNFNIEQIGSGGKVSWNVWSVPRFCKKMKMDIYHTEYIIPFFMPSFTKIITHIHDISFKVHKELITKKDAFFLNTLIPRAVKKSDKVIAVSQFTKDEIVKYYKVPESKIEVVYNAVNLEPLNRSNAEIREKYNLPQRYVLALGTMQPRKNIPFLISAFAQVAREVDDINLVLVGKKSHNFDDRIQKTIEKYPHIKEKVIFTGFVAEEDKIGVYKNAEVFVFPSLYEGFGVPILEAIEADTLVVASDIPPHKEIGGEGIIYFDPYSIDECSKTLYDSLDSDKMKDMIITEAKKQKTRFSWNNSVKKLKQIYEKI
ncbi:MAG: glycosyltransferase family 1 protein [Patescibacteria group bacterium]